ncbi:S9 family peptidase [Hoyosella rhizosphaerae]|uniref:Peptidase S9 n=1 Tax=Hoyosella rhizosphaerae TaxID=1755582 RepID=A0A916XHL9_9ACTN|nr:alpha/beta fold hydrolase [Hoyosella rhizosphaerae]MBN4928100.1 S9 family peptidase [Hoyosella rhizosphaerae]GGC72397.1 peptidase S9 [Hoyosella rhizosphaerae]
MSHRRGNNIIVTDANSTATPFHSLDDFVGIPRLSGLTLSPDGRRLVTSVSTLSDDATKYTSALWEIDPAGEKRAQQLTRGRRGDSAPAFTPEGDILFLSARGESDDDPASVWKLSAGGGEAAEFATSPLGIDSVLSARRADRILLRAPSFSAASSDEDDEKLRDLRKKNKISAILHTSYPVRFWDHDLGPEVPGFKVGGSDGVFERSAHAAALREASVDLSADGAFLVTTWNEAGPLGVTRTQLMRFDTDTHERSVIARENDADFGMPRVSPDGGRIAYVRESHALPDVAPDVTVHIYDIATGGRTQVAQGWDRWPTSLNWLADGRGLLATADHYSRAHVFEISATDPAAEVRHLTTDDAAYSDICVSPDGDCFYALRAGIASPPVPVRVNLASGEMVFLSSPTETPAVPGSVREVITSASDGTPVRAWLALPESADSDNPAPLLVLIHGGPLGSWNTWQWRWNPWLWVAKGYAVLLPDPALSTGFGRKFIQRGWGEWGKTPYTDLMALTDAAEELAEVDETRTAALGGSFGGYMANWIAGHTDRFKAIVTHASLWALDQFGPTTDAAWYWAREMTPEMAVENSPHLYVADIVTPMLVIHGDKDYRVPIGEALRLWYELNSESGLPADDHGVSEHQFLYFPSENHWILSPQHTKVWYETIFAFLSEKVLGQPLELPQSLGVELATDD